MVKDIFYNVLTCLYFILCLSVPYLPFSSIFPRSESILKYLINKISYFSVFSEYNVFEKGSDFYYPSNCQVKCTIRIRTSTLDCLP